MLRFAFAILMLGFALDAQAQGAPPFLCGPDCGQPGRFVQCLDNFDNDATSAGAVVLGPLDSACVTIPAPASTFRVTGFVALLGAGETLPVLVELYTDTGTVSAINKLYEAGAQAQFSATLGFTGLFFAAQTLNTDFRLCLRQQFGDPGLTEFTRPVAYDADGMQGINTMILAGRPNPPHGAWHFATDANVTGDFIIRVVVEHTEDMSPWAVGGVCDNVAPRDAGTPPPIDSGTVVRPDSGIVFPDAGATVVDSGPAPDGSATDRPAPVIAAITPSRGASGTPTDVIVTGAGFTAGTTLKIGAIPTVNVEVPGSTTLLATVPQGIAPGVYDVVVQNADGQAAILAGGFTIDGGSSAVVDEGCGCKVRRSAKRSGSASRQPRGSSLWLALGLLLLLRRSRASRRVKSALAVSVCRRREGCGG